MTGQDRRWGERPSGSYRPCGLLVGVGVGSGRASDHNAAGADSEGSTARLFLASISGEAPLNTAVLTTSLVQRAQFPPSTLRARRAASRRPLGAR